jgi:DNA mismatch repair ATPase MutS
MKELELIEKQKSGDNKYLYLVKVGMFYHAYDAAAYAISRLMHYKIKRKHRRGGDVLVAGFPISGIQKAIDMITSAGGEVSKEAEDVIVFSGIDASADEKMIVEEKDIKQNMAINYPLVDAIKSFDLMNSSPMNAMHFISVLKSMVS